MKAKSTICNLLKIKHLPPPFWVMAILIVAFLLQACEKDVSSAPPYADTLQSYYIESTHLGVASADSISTFTTKVNALTAAWPEVREEKQYYQIVENIRQSFLTFHITIDGEWDGIIEINKE